LFIFIKEFVSLTDLKFYPEERDHRKAPITDFCQRSEPGFFLRLIDSGLPQRALQIAGNVIYITQYIWCRCSITQKHSNETGEVV
jgi:hypothetical protein